jgi:hypothetical protein
MSADPQNFVDLDRAYRAARFKVITHLIFVVVCCGGALILRRFFRLPPLMIGIVLIVALLVFAGDIMRFLRLRDQRRQRQAALRAS